MNLIKRIFNFYYLGFKNMGNLGIKLWIIIFIKLFIMFAILRAFLFPNFLNSKYDTAEEKSEHVINQLTE